MLANWQMDMWSSIIGIFGFIPSFGFMIIVFTICLKIILSPLDFFNKKISRDSGIKQARIQPKLEKLKKQYKDPKIFQQKQMELYKKEGYNIYGSCLFMLLNLAVTLFIFITLWMGLSQMAQDRILKQYQDIQKEFDTTFYGEFEAIGQTKEEVNQKLSILAESNKLNAFNALQKEYNLEEIDETKLTDEQKQRLLALQMEYAYYDISIDNNITDIAVEAASKKYEEIKSGWLWVDNIWQPDTFVAGFPDYRGFAKTVNIAQLVNNNQITEEEFKSIYSRYDVITTKIQGNYSSWNGYFILVILAGAVTYLSFIVTQMISSKKKDKEQKKDANELSPAKTMSFMKFLMPVLMIYFTCTYSAAFALYIVVNSAMSLLTSYVSLKILEKIESNKPQEPIENKKIKKVEYSR